MLAPWESSETALCWTSREQFRGYTGQRPVLLAPPKSHLPDIHEAPSEGVKLIPHLIREAEMLHMVQDPAYAVCCCSLSTSED